MRSRASSGSPQTQLNIGKSIFFNERINTTGSGLVQVLLVDGSTFTVGPGSDLVIDKFVYDPNKKSGEVVATFSKGVMRFVGGKISKNEGGVTVNTPAGALAIRGGMFQTNGKVYLVPVRREHDADRQERSEPTRCSSRATRSTRRAARRPSGRRPPTTSTPSWPR